MRTFVVLCLVAVACADKLGYNYQPVGHSDNGLSFAPGGGSGVGPSGGGLGGIGGLGGGPSGGLGGLGGGSLGGLGGLGGGPSGGLGGLGGGPSGGGLGGGSDGGLGDGPGGAEPELEKEFFTFTANEEDFNEPEANEQVSNSLKQGLRVIFIKGPENKALENAALSLAKHASDQQTAIYVLNKQVDIGDLANKLNVIRNNNNNHPDVHFVKYRTPEDAANAQKAIQSQYDQLGGSSQSHDGGVAPVINFASPAAPVQGGHRGGSGGIGGPSGGIGGIGGPSGGIGGIGGPSATYLPASILRSLRL